MTRGREKRAASPARAADAHDAGLVAASTIDEIRAEARDARLGPARSVVACPARAADAHDAGLAAASTSDKIRAEAGDARLGSARSVAAGPAKAADAHGAGSAAASTIDEIRAEARDARLGRARGVAAARQGQLMLMMLAWRWLLRSTKSELRLVMPDLGRCS